MAFVQAKKFVGRYDSSYLRRVMAMDLFVVIGTQDGFAREDAHVPVAPGVFSEEPLAQQVVVLAGSGQRVVKAELDAIPLGFVQSAQAMGVALPWANGSTTEPEDGTVLFVVVGTVGGFAREDAPEPSLVGVYSQAHMAQRVSALAGPGHVVIENRLNEVSPGLTQQAESLGFGLRRPSRKGI